MLKQHHFDFLEEKLEANSDLKNNAMIELIKDKYGVEISDSKFRRTLHERGCSSVAIKISQKNTPKEQQKILELWKDI